MDCHIQQWFVHCILPTRKPLGRGEKIDYGFGIVFCKNQNMVTWWNISGSFQVPETLSDEVLGKLGAPPKSDVPIITSSELAEADGVLFGFPTRFGMMAAQFKAFLDSTGTLWRTQQLAGKPAGLFYSTGSQGGGQETTPWVLVSHLFFSIVTIFKETTLFIIVNITYYNRCNITYKFQPNPSMTILLLCTNHNELCQQ